MAWSTSDLALADMAGEDCVESDEPSLKDVRVGCRAGLERCDAIVVNLRRANDI
jgi:hypothetical protein